jgi:DNA (cytosine-5)-methyltransferase 1
MSYEKEIQHLDLFSGIGGFALAADQVFGNVQHTFVEYDPFCQAILKKHWPEAKINGDIKQFIADTKSQRGKQWRKTSRDSSRVKEGLPGCENCYILTGGFPCQPFSQAGRRKGTADDRYLWPAMLECITLFKPEWVIAENVAGLVSWNEGLVLQTVCTDLEKEGYEVQPYIIPAVAVGAPHRRDRVWIIANRNSERNGTPKNEDYRKQPESADKRENESQYQPFRHDKDTPNSTSNRWKWREQTIENEKGHEAKSGYAGKLEGRFERPHSNFPDWSKNWQEVAFATCHDGMDDGLPRQMDGTAISSARHRKERLKACGNAIVPQVAMQIMKVIKDL